MKFDTNPLPDSYQSNSDKSDTQNLKWFKINSHFRLTHKCAKKYKVRVSSVLYYV